MRLTILLIAAAAALTACDRAEGEGKPTLAATPAAISYDGAGATDRAALLAHGERMARMLGCKGCHGDNLQGKNVTEGEPEWGDMWAPNLSLLMASYSDAEFHRAVRAGVPKDGREMWFMPSEAFAPLSDADFAALTAYLRTVPQGGKPTPPIRRGPLVEKLIAAGEASPAPAMVAKFMKDAVPDLGPEHALGRYIARTTCAECHNNKLQGVPEFSPNVVAMVGGYDTPALRHLLATGEGKVKKDLGLMTITARNRFSRLTTSERDALIAYLQALAQRPS